jgi:hypothetical protein
VLCWSLQLWGVPDPRSLGLCVQPLYGTGFAALNTFLFWGAWKPALRPKAWHIACSKMFNACQSVIAVSQGYSGLHRHSAMVLW